MSSESTATTEKQPDKDKKQEIKEDKEDDKGLLFSKGEFPGWVQSEFDRFYGTQTAKKTKYLAEQAQKDSFDIDLYPLNKSLDDPDADIDITDVNIDGKFETKQFKVHDATTQQWQMMLQLRGDLAGAEQYARDCLTSAPRGGLGEEKMEQLRNSCNTKSARSYYYQAKVFFRMSKEEYNRAERRQIIDACDSMTHRTLLSIPKSQPSSRN